MSALRRVERRTRLGASADDVWALATTPSGVNRELGPWLRMTLPRRWRGADLASVPLDEPLGRSWILLFGVLPVDWDDLRLVERGPLSFQEDSSTATLRRWRHRRVVTPDGDGCVVEDVLELAPRRAVPGALAQRVVGALFAHRHRRLLARWGAAPDGR